MNWLLKIVEGPLKGAEIALVNGRRVSVGSDDACDIVIADRTLGPKAFELDVSDAAVTVLLPNGEAKALAPFEVRAFGTTAIAVGPADGPWKDLVYSSGQWTVDSGQEAVDSGQKAVDSEQGAVGSEQSAVGSEQEPAEPAPEPEKKRHGCGCFGCLGVLLLALALAFLAWFFWWKLVERWPALEDYRAAVTEKISDWWMKGKSWFVAPEPVVETGPSLAEVAEQYGISLEDGDPPKLTGNVRRRTERLAIRAIALNENPFTEIDLTDDESMLTAVEASLFALTEGAVRGESVSNRVAVLSGYAPSRAKFEGVVRGLNEDVPKLTALETAQVRIGGTPPPGLEKTAFVTGAAAPGSLSRAARRAAAERAAARGSGGSPSTANSPLPTASGGMSVLSDPFSCPIAGILQKPYPCVILRTGERVCEGAVIAGTTLVKIGPESLTFLDGETTFEWRP